jgi:tripartite-type tricarboxylate transporter receptor subunit TctC
MVVPFAPGGTADIIARPLAQRLSEQLGQAVVIDNRGGAGGGVGADVAAKAAPDGYTLLLGSSGALTISPNFGSIPYDAIRDFTPIGLAATSQFILVVHPSVQATSVKQLIALAGTKPGTLRYGSAGTGASEHLSGVLLNHLTGTNMLHVPYKGVAQSITDALANEVQMTYAVLPAALPHIQGGRLRALGVTTAKRATLIPDVPAIGEVVPGYAMNAWYSIVVKNGTPAPVLAAMSREMVKVLREPAFGEKMKGLGIDMVSGDSATLDAWRRDENKRIVELVKISGAKETK